MRLLSWFVFLGAGLMLLQAENGRDFAGQYTTSNVVENGRTAYATLTVHLFNYSGHEIKDARLLQRTDPPGAAETELAGYITLANHSGKTIKAEITLSAAELDRWRRGSSPQLTVEFFGDDGQPVRRPVELMRATAAIPEVQ